MSTLPEQLREMESHRSIFESALRRLSLPVCPVFGSPDEPVPIRFSGSEKILRTPDNAIVARSFPLSVNASGNTVLVPATSDSPPPKGRRVAVLFSGGPASGGHNVVAGIRRVLGDGNTLLGVTPGPKGLIQGSFLEITDEAIHSYVNTGGFDFLGTDRTKIKTDAQFRKVRENCVEHDIDAIIIIGGDDSNTNAAILAEYLFKDVKSDGSGVQVIGVPKTIDGDLQVKGLLPISFGFDTATKIYSEMVGNILQDTRSSLKYWHFVKLMGRSASHVTLEVALQAKPAVALISEEVAERKQSLSSIVDQIARTVIARARKGMNHGVILVPEGLIEFIPEMHYLIVELNDVLAHNEKEFSKLHDSARLIFIQNKLSSENARLLASLPDYIVNRLLTDRDSHGNLQVSLIPTEQLLIDMIARYAREIDASIPFAAQSHFFGYEGRCGAPTRFDAAYTYNLGLTAASLVLDGRTGYMASVTELTAGGYPIAIPLTGLLQIERRQGQDEFVIRKALVEMNSPSMRYFASRRGDWADDDYFSSPGPRQMWGPASRQQPISVALNTNSESLEFKIG
ncbi:MAG: diphosphate--fructose-6-phosphate 1-phosphotransferase [Candidatus Accumulibacter sp.]|jgi:pyrophosphate--fructose-6-phosphate 1-phosphotransferase|nr:diphosphate--fructose-6-phosphate 1-phosphotransferase [Accumulibacter sp.]